MITLIVDESECTIPDWVEDRSSFIRWLHSDEAPERGRFWWLQGKVWADTTMEEIFSHVAVKTEYTSVLHWIVNASRVVSHRRVLVENEADLAGEPDGLFISNETRSRLVQFIEEVEGYTGRKARLT
jgi:hypothetical protein